MIIENQYSPPYFTNRPLGENGEYADILCGDKDNPTYIAQALKENAAFIVKACNCHYELLEALTVANAQLQELRDTMFDNGKNIIKNALRKAKS